MTKGTTTSDTTMSSPKISKSSILSALNETTKQAAKAEAEKKRLAEEAQKAKELKREQQREDRIKRREEKQRLKTTEAEKKKAALKKSREEEKAMAEFAAKNSGDINETMMGEQWESLSDDERSEDGANKTLFKENDEDEDINSPDYKKGKSTGGGCLKSDWRYSTREEGTRKSAPKATPLSTGYGRTGLLQEIAYVDISIDLSSEDKPSEFLGGIQGLLKECHLLTEAGLVELTHQEGKEPLVIKNVSSLPTSYTLLSKFVDIKSENPFKQNWYDKKNQTAHRDDDDKTFTKLVHATVQITANMEISELIKGISTQCSVNGVKNISIKKVQAAKSKFVANLLFVSLRTSEEAVRYTFLKMCNSVLHEERKANMSDEDEALNIPMLNIPIGLKLQVPTLYNIGTGETLAWKVKKLRQVWHLEVPVDKAKEVLRIIGRAKELKLINTAFNSHTIIAEVMSKEDSIIDNERMMKTIVDVADYNYNMSSVKLSGFTNMSAGVLLAGEGTEAITGLEFLPKVLKVAGGIPLIAEIYQIHPGCEVEVIFLDCTEGHHIIAQLQKNPAAYLFHALRNSVDEPSVRRMAVGICEAVYVDEIDECEWNEETKTLTIPSEKEGNKTLEHKDSPFWKMAIELVEKDEYDKRNKKKFNPDAFIDLDNVRSIKSIHNRSKMNSKVKFGPELDDDELSAGSTSTIDTLDHDRNTEATGKPPSNEQASTSVVSPNQGSVDGSIPAASG